MAFFEDLALGVLVIFVVVILVWVTKLNSKLSDPKKLSEEATKVGTIASALSTDLSALRTEVSNIRENAAKIATWSEGYRQTEERISLIHAYLIGSYSKGRTGEQILRNMMTELVRSGLVQTNLRFGTQVVEYGVKFSDGKILAVDSKIVGTSEVEKMNQEGISAEDKKELADELVSKISKRIDDVAQYISSSTLPFAVMAIPDSLMENASELIGKASDRNVIIAGYSAVPSLVASFLKIHAMYTIPQDIKLLTESLFSVQNALNKFDGNYFSNRFAKPLITMENALEEIKSGITDALKSVGPANLESAKPSGDTPEKLDE